MRTFYSLIIALVLGVTLAAIGISIITYGLAQPIICQGYTNRGVCGNLPLIVGALMTLTGLVTMGGSIAYALGVWEHSDSEIEDD